MGSLSISGFLEAQKNWSVPIKQLIFKAHQRSLLAFKQYPLFFSLFFILNFLVVRAFEAAIEMASQTLQGTFLVQAYGAVAEITIACILLFAYALALQNLEYKPETLKEFLKRTLAPFAAESFKAFAHIILGLIFFIIPGIVFYVFYTFLAYIVFFNPQYDQGNLRALKESRRLAKAHFLPLFIQILILGLIAIGLQLGPKMIGMTNIGFEFVVFVLSYYVSAFSFMYFYELYKLYENDSEEKI